LAGTLAEFGIGVLRFDFTGLGQSDGDFASSDFTTQTSDIEDAARWLGDAYGAPSVLIGHSLGGTAALYAARNIESIRAVATIGSPADPSHVEKLFEESEPEIHEKGSTCVSIGGRPFLISESFLADLKAHPPETWLPQLRKELLILHSPVDTIVGIDNAEQIFRATKHPKSFVSLRQSDHLMSKSQDAEYAGRIIGAWAETFMHRPVPEELSTNQQVAARIERDHYTVRLRAGRHYMLADEPGESGGGDLGGNPYDYLLSALGSCTAMTLRMYADRKEWPLNAVTVHLRHQKAHADDMSECEAEAAHGSKIDRIERELELEGELSEEQREKLVEIADKCPVHRTLTGPIRVKTSLR